MLKQMVGIAILHCYSQTENYACYAFLKIRMYLLLLPLFFNLRTSYLLLYIMVISKQGFDHAVLFSDGLGMRRGMVTHAS